MEPKDANRDASAETKGAAAAPGASNDVDSRAPDSLRVLATQFAALEFGLSSLALYQRTPDFDAARLAVESSTQLTFTLAQLQQVLALLPGAYALAWQKRKRGGGRKSDESGEPLAPWSLTIRKLPLVVDTTKADDQEPASMAERISLFRAKVNALVDQKACELQRNDAKLEGEALAKALEQVELEMAPLPDIPTASTSSESKETNESKTEKQQEDEKEAAKDAEAVKAALEAPVPQELQTLPSWLVAKVRRRELAGRETARKNARALEKRVVSSLPQLSDQLESLVLATRKTVFALDALETQLGARVPVKGKLEEQIFLLESMVPFWLSVRLSGGRQYVQLERKAKYNKVKAALREAVAEALEQL